jgi:hypothetical protein
MWMVGAFQFDAQSFLKPMQDHPAIECKLVAFPECEPETVLHPVLTDFQRIGIVFPDAIQGLQALKKRPLRFTSKFSRKLDGILKVANVVDGCFHNYPLFLFRLLAAVLFLCFLAFRYAGVAFFRSSNFSMIFPSMNYSSDITNDAAMKNQNIISPNIPAVATAFHKSRIIFSSMISCEAVRSSGWLSPFSRP